MATLEGTDEKSAGINRQGVNDEGQAFNAATIETEIEHVSQRHSQGFSWSSGIVDIDAADTVLLVKNTSDGELHIDYYEINNGSYKRRKICCSCKIKF